LDLTIGICLSLQQLMYETRSDYFDISFTFISAGIVLGLLIAIPVILKKNPDLEDPKFEEKYGSLTDGLRTSGISVGFIKKTIVWFLIRRLLTGLIMVLLVHVTIWVQLAANLSLTLLDTCFTYHMNVYKEEMSFYMAMFNDAIVLFLSYFPFLFTDFILDLETRYYAGWIYIAIVALMIVVNVIVVSRDTVLTMAEEARRKSGELHNYPLVKKRGLIDTNIKP